MAAIMPRYNIQSSASSSSFAFHGGINPQAVPVIGMTSKRSSPIMLHVYNNMKFLMCADDQNDVHFMSNMTHRSKNGNRNVNEISKLFVLIIIFCYSKMLKHLFIIYFLMVISSSSVRKLMHYCPIQVKCTF